MATLYILFFVTVFITLFFMIKLLQLKKGKQLAAKQRANMKINKLPAPGTVKALSIMPLVDYYTDNPDLKTEPGVSYFISADDTRILLDVGFNKKKRTSITAAP